MKKFTALFLVFSLMMISVNLYAKRRGAKLIITKKDGQLIEGELITAKPNSLLLLNTEGKDVSIDIGEIKVIKVVKKLMDRIGMAIGIGGTIGAGIGGGIGALVGYAEGDDPGYPYNSAGTKALIYGLGSFCLGWLIGGIIGVIVITDKSFQIEGMTDSEIQKILKKLHKKARIHAHK